MLYRTIKSKGESYPS